MSARHKPGAAPPGFELRSASMTLVVVALKTTDMAAIERAFVERFADTPGMFDHDPVVIDVAQAEGDPAAIDWPELAALMWRFDMVAAAVRGGTPEQMAAALAAGLGLAPEAAPPAPRAPASVAGSTPAALVHTSAGQPVAERGPRADSTVSTVADMPATPAGGVMSDTAAAAASTAAIAAVSPTTAGASAASTTAGAPATSSTAAAPTAIDAAASPASPSGSLKSAAPAPDASPALSGLAEAPAEPPTMAPATVAATLIVDRPLRSGQQVYARGGDLVVLAAVNFGAEVIADGSIHVYAPLRGKAVAGAKGDRTARIFSTCMEPQLIAVAGTYRTTDSPLPANVIGKPAQIRLDGERLVFEPLG